MSIALFLSASLNKFSLSQQQQQQLWRLTGKAAATNKKQRRQCGRRLKNKRTDSMCFASCSVHISHLQAMIICMD